MKPQPDWVSGCMLDDNARKARYGALYVRGVASQAGWLSQETSPDEDRAAVDMLLGCVEGWVEVQVKCGTLPMRDGGIRQGLDRAWVTKWSKKNNPVYLVYVLVPPHPPHWIEHVDAKTHHATSAFWIRVDKGVSAPSVVIPGANRFTADTLTGWRANLLAGFRSKTDGAA